MAAIVAFRCRSCSKIREGSPSFGYSAAHDYLQIPESDRERRAKLTSDICGGKSGIRPTRAGPEYPASLPGDFLTTLVW